MKHKWCGRIILAAIVFFTGIFLCLSNAYMDTEYNKIENPANITRIDFEKGDLIEQPFSCYLNKINSLGVCIVNKTQNSEGTILLEILDDTDSCIWSKTVDVKRFSLKKFRWDKVYKDVDINKQYRLRISSSELTGRLQFAGIDKDSNVRGVNNEANLNGSAIESSLFIEMTYFNKIGGRAKICILLWTLILSGGILGVDILFANKKRILTTITFVIALAVISTYFRFGITFKESANYKLFALYLILFILFTIISFILVLKNEKRVERYFLVSSIIFGVLFSISMPPFSAPDEDIHFITAYKMSNVIMGQRVNDENGYIYMRECDIRDYEHYPSNEYSIDLLRELGRREEESKDLVPSPIKSYHNTAVYAYISQTIGITIGRILGANFAQLIYIGRIINLLTFIFITYWAIKIIPYGKWIIYAICQIPLVLELTSSFSYDVYIIGLAFLLISNVLKMIQAESKVSNKTLILFGILCALYPVVKPPYMLLAGLVLLIPNKNISEKTKSAYIYKATVLILTLISVVLLRSDNSMLMTKYYSDATVKSVNDKQDSTMVLDESEVIFIVDSDHYGRKGIDFIFENPLDFIESFSVAIMEQLDEYSISMFGGYLGWYDTRLPVYNVMLVVVLFFMAIHLERSNGKNMTKGRQIFVLSIILGVVVGVFFSLYTIVTMPHRKMIDGIQGRYFIPILAMSVFLLRQKNNILVNTDEEENQSYKIILMTGLLNVISILNVISDVWSR